MSTPRSTLIGWFKRGLKPLETQFEAWMNSYWHKTDDSIPMSAVDGLVNAIINLRGLYFFTQSTTPSTITVDFANNLDVACELTGTISSLKIIQFSNTSSARRAKLLTRVAAGALLELPANVWFEQGQEGWNSNTQQLNFAMIGNGHFQIELSYMTEGAFWQAQLHGPFNPSIFDTTFDKTFY